jgi:glutamate carboxypeptidase
MTEIGEKLLAAAQEEKEAMISLLMDLAAIESPSDDPESQEPIQARIAQELTELGFKTRKIPGKKTGGSLLAVPNSRVRGRKAQLMLGHCDTVWTKGTLNTMPLLQEGNRIRGPGVFDMKAGLTLMIVALRLLQKLGLEPNVTPVILVNSDEEIGSPESGRHIRRISKRVIRAFVPEPAMGLEGKLKTVRKGWSRFTVKVKGKAAHAGLNPADGASAILELAHQIQALQAMTDLEKGITVNVGVVSGGTRSNVIASDATGEVDVRVLTNDQALEVRGRILSLVPTVPGQGSDSLPRAHRSRDSPGSARGRGGSSPGGHAQEQDLVEGGQGGGEGIGDHPGGGYRRRRIRRQHHEPVHGYTGWIGAGGGRCPCGS